MGKTLRVGGIGVEGGLERRGVARGGAVKEQVGEELLRSALASSLYGLGSMIDRSFTREIRCYGPGLWCQGLWTNIRADQML